MGERKLEYKDSKGQDCYFYYSNIAGTDLDMLGYVPVADIESEVTDWSIVLLVSVLNPGTVIGPHSNVYPTSCVRGMVPANSIWKTGGIIVAKK